MIKKSRRSANGMPEVRNMPIPQVLVEKGMRDMVRISDGRMSGTAIGIMVLHVSLESNVGGLLALDESGDRIRLDTGAGSLELLVDEETIAKRHPIWQPEPRRYSHGYAKLYMDHVLQADCGADLDFLVGKDTRLLSRESH